MKLLTKTLLISLMSVASVLGEPQNNNFWSQFEVVNDASINNSKDDYWSQFEDVNDLSKYGFTLLENSQIAQPSSNIAPPSQSTHLNKNKWESLGFVPDNSSSVEQNKPSIFEGLNGIPVEHGKRPIRRWVPPRDYLTEIKDSLSKIFDSCLIIGGIALIFIILQIFYSIRKFIDSLTIRFSRHRTTKDNCVTEGEGS